MNIKSISLSEQMHAYLLDHATPPDQVVNDLIEETRAALPDQMQMQVAPEQVGLLTMLTRILGVHNAVEVGTFTGLSSLSIARGLAAGGRLICFDSSDEFTSVARRYWRRAGVDDRIELRLGDAREQLSTLPTDPHLDLAFIDADKVSYPAYWSQLVPRMRSGGVILVDNVFQGGRVIDPQEQGESVTAIRAFNQQVRDDERVEVVMLPVADGLTLARCR